MSLLRKKGIFESNRVMFLPAASIRPNPNQPRRRFEQAGLEELAASIRENGILQPLSVRRVNGQYELVSGERRLRAAHLAGLNEVPSLVVDVGEEGSSLLALIENLQRRDLDFWEESLALERLIRTHSLSQEQAAKKLGKSQSAVANKLRLLKLDPEALTILRDGGCTERHARALLRLPTSAAQREAACHVTKHQLTVARTEQHVAALLTPRVPKKRPTYLIRDVRFFLNTVTRGLSLMQSAGVDAQYGRQETDDSILLTIRIPK